MGTVLLAILCCQENRPHDNYSVPKKRAPLFQGRVARGTNPFHAATDIPVPKPRLECL